MATTLDIAALEGQQRLDAYRKAHEDKSTIAKALVPSVTRLTYDQVMKSFEVEQASFTDDAVAYLTKEPSQSMRVLEFVGSTERRDRDGDRILVAGWDMKEWKRNPAFPWAHDYGGLPRAVGLKAWKDTVGDVRALKFLVMFPENLESEDAQKVVDMIFSMYASSPPMLKAVSVGFRPTSMEFAETEEDREKMDLGAYGVLIKKAELWELSGCIIGSNYDALLFSAKKTYGAEAPKLLDALGFEIASSKTIIAPAKPKPKPEPADDKTVPEVIIPLAAITGEDPEAREALKTALEDRVTIGQNAKNLLDTLFSKDQEDEPQEPETKPTEPDSGEPSDAESDEEPPDEIPDGVGEDVYGDGDLFDDMEEEPEPDADEEEAPPENEDSGDLIDDFA